jgi:sulfhydrogenase subunit beta (sulfur reductase)
MNFVSREAVANWLDALARRSILIAPRQVEDELLYQPVSDSTQIVFNFERTALPPKAFFFPETEVILEVEKRGSTVELDEPAPSRDQVLFGLRPCDAQGLKALDALLLDRPPPDAYYARRRATTALVGLACPKLWDSCFCTSLGSSPDDPSGMDVMLYEGQEGYWVLGITDRGMDLLAGLEGEETEAKPPAPDLSGHKVPVLPPEGWPGQFDDVFWQRLAERCLSCHACTYVCPTCRCFDVRDEMVAAGPGHIHIQRLRAWDSCLSPGYRRIAGGHNPRPDRAQRLRNRYYCKFCYSSLDFGTVACVGCGRCIDVCPAGVDIVEVLAAVAERG